MISAPLSAAPQPKTEDKGPSVDVTINGLLDESDEKDRLRKHPCKIHTVKLPKGATVQIDMISTDFDSYLRLEDSKGTQLAVDDDSGGNLNARIIFTVPATGDYNLIATTFNGGVGNYQLLVKPLVAAKVTRIKGPDGDKTTTVADKLTKDDGKDLKSGGFAKIYEVELPQKTFEIELKSKDFAPILRVLDKTGQDVGLGGNPFANQFANPLVKVPVNAPVNVVAGNGNAWLAFTPPVAGTYRIVATSSQTGTGDFQLEIKTHVPPKAIKAKAPDVGKSIKIEDKLTQDDPKDLKQRQPSKHFEVELAAGDYQIDLRSTAFDAYLRVLDKNGVELAFDDDGGEGRNSRLIFTPPAPGAYRLVATTFAGGIGDFELEIKANAPGKAIQAIKTKAPAAGKTVTIADKLTNDDGKDQRGRRPAKIFEVELDANDYQIDLVSGAFDSYLRVLDKNGKELTFDDDSGGYIF
jgi:hypothetical protein